MKVLKTALSLLLGSIVCLALGCVTATTSRAFDFAQHPLLLGTNLTLYIGTDDTATTFTVSNPTYNTNRVYTTPGGQTVTPGATNSITGQVYAIPATKAPTWPSMFGTAASNAVAVHLNWTIDAAYTNTATTVYLWRSCDGGAHFDQQSPFIFSFDMVNNTTCTTNVPAEFLAGASHVQVWKIVTGANPPDNANVTFRRILLTGWKP